MTDTPFGPLESLVGRTFERGCVRRKPLWVQGVNRRHVVYEFNGGKVPYKMGATRFCAWLRGAREVTE